MKIIISKSLVLRHFNISDAPDYFESEIDPVSIRMHMSYPKNLDEAKKEVKEIISDYKKKPILSESFVIGFKGKYAGSVTIQYQNFDLKNREGRVHVTIHPRYRGKGLATISLGEACNYGFKKYQFKRIFAQHKSINKAVENVNKKVGFKLVKEGIIDGLKKKLWVLENPNLFPKNKKYFKRLIPFTKSLIKLCQENNLQPIIYGSYLVFYLTKDINLEVKDIDFYIYEKDFPLIIKLLKNNNIKFNYSKDWHTLEIKKGDLKVEFDSIDFWYKGKPSFENIDFYGKEVKSLTKDSLIKLYKIAYQNAKDKKIDYKNKYELISKLK